MEILEKIGVKLKVVSDKAGLDKVKGDYLGLAGDLAEPMILLAAGASKAQVAWSTFSSFMEMRILGPLSVISGLSAAALTGINALGKGFAEMGMSGAESLEGIETRFKAILRSQQLARERVEMNVKLAKTTPYSQEAVMEANRSLEILTQGAFANEKAMMMVGDAAAASGREFNEVARWVGRLYDALASGAPIGESTLRLQEMGVVTGETRRTLQSMVESGASFSETWRVAESQLKKSSGAMEDLSQNLEGLRSTYADVREVMSAKFSEGYLEGEKASIAAKIKLYEELTPVVEYYGQTLGRTQNWIAKFKAGVIEAIVSSKAFAPTLTIAGTALLGFLAAATLAGGYLMTKFGVAVLRSVTGMGKNAQATNASSAATVKHTQTTRMLTASKLHLMKALAGVRAGNLATAKSHLALSGAQAKAAVSSNAVGVASIGLSSVMKGLGKVVGFVANAFRVMLVSLVLNPYFWAAAAIIGVATALVKVTDHFRAAAEATREYNDATDALARKMDQQIRSIRTAGDLLKAHHAILVELAKAHDDVNQAIEKGDKAQLSAARLRKIVAESRLDQVQQMGKSDLALTEREQDRMRTEEAEMRKIREKRLEDQRSRMSPAEEAESLTQEAEKARRKYRKVMREFAAEKELEEKQLKEKTNARELDFEIGKAEGELRTLERTKDRRISQAGQTGEDAYSVRRAMDQEKERIEHEKAELESRIEELQRIRVEANTGIRLALESESEVSKLRAQISLRDQYQNQYSTVEQTEGELEGLKGKDRKDKLSSLEQEKRQLESLRQVAEEYGVALTNAAQSRDEFLLSQEQERQKRDGDKVAMVEKDLAARRATARAEYQARRDTLDTAQTIMGLQDGGLEIQLRILNAEREKLLLQKEYTDMSDQALANSLTELAAREQAMRREADRRREDARLDTELARIKSIQQLRESEGDTGAAKGARGYAEAIQQTLDYREALEQARGMNFENEGAREAYAEDVMNEKAKIRERQREIQEARRERTREATERDREIAASNLREGVLRGVGRRAFAEQEKKIGDRIRDEQLEAERKQKYIDQGFGAAAARNMAGRDVAVQQAQRMLEEMQRVPDAQITASSLRRVGGGGGVSGIDPIARRIDLTNELLKHIRDNGLRGRETYGVE